MKTDYHGEPFVYERRHRNFFLKNLSTILEKCLDFKEGPPVKRGVDGKFSVDVDAVIKSSTVFHEGEKIEKVISLFSENILDQSLNFGSPSFLAHPDNGSGMAAIMGDVARGLMQQNLVSYEYSPAATYVEYALLQQIRELIGYEVRHTKGFSAEQQESGFFDSFVFGCDSEDDSKEDFSVGLTGGAFVFGGTNANMAGLLAAREKLKQKLAKQERIYDPRKVRVLTKVPFAHYSMRRSAQILGIGNSDLTDAQIRDLNLSKDLRIDVASKNYKIDIHDLEVKINSVLESGEDILCIFALAGDSRMVSFDDLKAVTALSEKYDLWVHADGCEGGQCLFSPRRKHLFDGIERVNSISLDPHKVLMIPYNLSIFMLRDVEDMELIDIGTSLVRLGSLSHGTYTPGIGSKDFSSLRLWFLLKHLGWDRLAEEIDRRHELAKATAAMIKNMNDLLLINEEITHNAVAFVFCPLAYRHSKEFDLAFINDLNKEIHHRLNSESGYYLHMMSSKDDNAVLAKNKDNITILRAMYGNPSTTELIVRGCLDRVIGIGHEIFATQTEKNKKYGVP